MQQRWGELSGRTVCWIGDYNNVARSLSLAAAMTGMAMRIASPPGYGPTDVDVERLIPAGAPEAPYVTNRPPRRPKGPDAVHQDRAASRGHGAWPEARRPTFPGLSRDDEG